MYNQLIISLLGESSPHSYQSSRDQRRQKGSLSHAAQTDQTRVLKMNIWPSEKNLNNNYSCRWESQLEMATNCEDADHPFLFIVPTGRFYQISS